MPSISVRITSGYVVVPSVAAMAHTDWCHDFTPNIFARAS